MNLSKWIYVTPKYIVSKMVGKGVLNRTGRNVGFRDRQGSSQLGDHINAVSQGWPGPNEAHQKVSVCQSLSKMYPSFPYAIPSSRSPPVSDTHCTAVTQQNQTTREASQLSRRRTRNVSMVHHGGRIPQTQSNLCWPRFPGNRYGWDKSSWPSSAMQRVRKVH